MITADYCRLMARYSTWQYNSLMTAADHLSEKERRKDRGAFFRSIAATLNHLYWADILQIRRIGGDERPHDALDVSVDKTRDWNEFKDLRSTLNSDIEKWALKLEIADLDRAVAWYPVSGGARSEKSGALCVVQLFNHQTHHRGQIHAMLTAAGVQPEPTDLSMTPIRPENRAPLHPQPHSNPGS